MSLLNTMCGKPSAGLHATAVIVLYRMSPGDSPAFRSLIDARNALSRKEDSVSIVVWDNSPSSQLKDPLPDGVLYFHDPTNPGIASAYNYALDIAARDRAEWLITLDQDTSLPCDYLIRMALAARLCTRTPGVGAIVPQIASGDKRLSPSHFVLGAIPRWHRMGFRGLPEHDAFAFNSGSMIRADALQQIGGYDPSFPLDYSDTVMFHKLHQHGKRVYIEGAIQLQHHFSLINLNQSMDPARYHRLLSAESALWDTYMNRIAGCERTARLLLRMFRHWIRNDRPDLRRITFKFLALRLLTSRKTRMRIWRESGDKQSTQDQVDLAASKTRPKISVCMAAYNGSRFIEAQLNSILPQLDYRDQIVVIDDCSIDDTVERVIALADERIQIFTHEKNLGVVVTFEDALRAATGDILFLCDDDDLWAPNKVEEILHQFAAHPDTQVVASRVALIDDHGAAIPDGRVNRHGKFFPGFWRNILKNHYQGSAMAIRASLLSHVLPFPRRKSFLHDVWIGTRNEITGGKAIFIDAPLVFYRRHSHNVSQTRSLLKQFQIRFELLMAHLSRLILTTICERS